MKHGKLLVTLIVTMALVPVLSGFSWGGNMIIIRMHGDGSVETLSEPEYTYDAYGRLLSESYLVDDLYRETTAYTYDKDGHILATGVYAAGVCREETENRYDDRGNEVYSRNTMYEDDGTQYSITWNRNFVYDENGRLVLEETDGDFDEGYVEVYHDRQVTWGPWGIDVLDMYYESRHIYEYDANGRLVREEVEYEHSWNYEPDFVYENCDYACMYREYGPDGQISENWYAHGKDGLVKID